jgi:hypothetical protein
LNSSNVFSALGAQLADASDRTERPSRNAATASAGAGHRRSLRGRVTATTAIVHHATTASAFRLSIS